MPHPVTAPHASPAPVIWDRAPRTARLSVFAPRHWIRLRLIADAVVLYLAVCAAIFASPGPRPDAVSNALAFFFPVLVIAMLRVRRSPDSRLHASLLDTIAYSLGAVSLACMVLTAIGSGLDAQTHGIMLRVWLFSAVYLGLSRATMVSLRRSAMRSGAYSVPTLIVGAGVVGSQLVRRLLSDPSYGLKPVGFVDSDPLPGTDLAATPVPVLGGPDELEDAVALTGARRVILAFSSEPDHILVSKVRQCQELGVDVSLVPRLYESIGERASVDHVGGLPLLTLNAVDPRGWQFAVKYALDRVVAALAIVLFSPLLLACAVAVKLSSAEPVLFRQRRVGRDGHTFDLLKFRTMNASLADFSGTFVLAEGLAPGGVEGTDRRTTVGRVMRSLSFDELPQLFNVLRGDMSIVGPRPERPEFVELFMRDVARYEDRHRVKSGITGWAQVHGLRGRTSIADRVEWDNYYIRNWSLRLDLRILAMTVVEVLRLRERRSTSEPAGPRDPAEREPH
jgi:exopolysaccharide biosynthesis polyprenyl glycosylphosphotransferase